MNAVRANVKLVCHSPGPEQLLAAAAKLCYAPDTEGLFEQDPASAGRFVKMLRELGHLSPIEHATFTFYIEGVSRAMTHQLVRHRLASYSQRSQRYVDHDDFDYVVPPQLQGKTVDDQGRQVDAVEYFNDTMRLIAGRYACLNKALGQEGESSNEDARYVLPNACETKILVTMNARELLHFFEECLCLRAQWEIRNVADRMLELVRPLVGGVFDGIGPKCIRLGRCPEGKMTCGRYSEMKAGYAESAPGRGDAPEQTPSGSGQPRPDEAWSVQVCRGQEGHCSFTLTALLPLKERLDAAVRASGWDAFVRGRVAGPLLPHHRLRIAVAACPNACTQPQVRDIGLIASVRPRWITGECTACGQCVQACKEDAMRLGETTAVFHGQTCVGCGLCVAECPVGAIVTDGLCFRLLVGGRLGRLGRHPAWAKEMPETLEPGEAPDAVGRLLAIVMQQARDRESFADVVHRLGAAGVWDAIRAGPQDRWYTTGL